MQHIIYQYHIFIFYAEGDFCLGRHVYFVALMHIISVKSDIQLAIRYALLACNAFQQACNTVRQQYNTWLYAYQYSIFQLGMVLNQLMSEALERNV